LKDTWIDESMLLYKVVQQWLLQQSNKKNSIQQK
jgi:hypothetical protein